MKPDHDPFWNANQPAIRLSFEQERDLLTAYRTKGCRKALEKLVVSHTQLVGGFAKRFSRTGVSFPDLCQHGTMGLIYAAGKFDLSQPVRFSTYARLWVRNYIRDAVNIYGRTVNAPSIHNDSRAIKLMRVALIKSGRESLDHHDLEQIAADSGYTAQRLKDLEPLIYPSISLNSQTTRGDLMEFLADERPTPESAHQEASNRRKITLFLNGAMGALSDRERDIIKSRWLSEQPRPLRELGEQYGLTKERVRQIETAALVKMRKAMPKEARGVL